MRAEDLDGRAPRIAPPCRCPMAGPCPSPLDAPGSLVRQGNACRRVREDRDRRPSGNRTIFLRGAMKPTILIRFLSVALLMTLIGCATQRNVVNLDNVPPAAEPILTMPVRNVHESRELCIRTCDKFEGTVRRTCEEFCRCIHQLGNTLGDAMRCVQEWIDKLK
jgi:hypothetical protein